MRLSTTTIVAPVTPPGEGGVTILRLSGPAALSILKTVFVGRTPVDEMLPRTLYLGFLHDSHGRAVDQVLVVFMPEPHSYTGEQVVEVHCHGGSQIRRTVLNLLLSSGAALAGPGEFTQRAFLNGRLDLAQAESVMALIQSRSEGAGRAALAQLGGVLSRSLICFTRGLKESLSLLEAHIDFSDDDVGSLDLEPLRTRVFDIQRQMAALKATFDTGRILREGLSLLLLGRPNVGKSSLLNALLGEPRAIVTDVPGTTRDIIEEQLVLGGLPVRLIDCAGVRETPDLVEREGLLRTRARVDSADLILLVVDSSSPAESDDSLAAKLCDPQKTLLVLNKADLPGRFRAKDLGDFPRQIHVSAQQGLGLDDLIEAVTDAFDCGRSGRDVNDEVVLTERRHYQALVCGEEALSRFLVAAETPGVPFECLAIDLREALAALGQITGETTPDEILEQIFSRFCIGK